MKRNVKLIQALAALFALLMLNGCAKYVSNHSATGFVHTNSAKAGDMRFSSFRGSQTFTMKVDGEAGGQIRYSASLESGAATVYYDTDGTKRELFSITAGENVDAAGGELVKGKLYVIVETTENCKNGEFRFSIQ